MILAADLGSTNFKAALFTPNGDRVGEASVPVPCEVHTSTRAELSPHAVVETFEQAVTSTLAAAGVPGTDVQRVSITSQAQTFCLCGYDGSAMSSFTSWSDQRAEREAARLQSLLGDCFHQRTGWPHPAAGQLAAQALWTTNHIKEASENYFVTLPSYLAMCLGAPFVIDRNLAAMTGLYDIPGRSWWPAALEATGLQAGQLGMLVEPGQPVAARRPAAGKLRGSVTPREVILAGNDHTAAAVACACSAQRAILTVGTAGVFYRRPSAGGTGPLSSTGIWGPYPSGGSYELHFFPDACCALDWADSFLFGRIDSEAFASAAREAGTAGGVRFNPAGWGSPTAWIGQGTRGQKAMAVLQGIAESLQGLAACVLEKPLCAELEIVVIGGGSRIDFWMQMLADVLQRDLTRVATDSLDGAARLAGVTGLGSDEGPTTVFRPRSAHAGTRPAVSSSLGP